MSWPWAMVVGGALAGAPGEPGDVVVSLGGGVRVNWTECMLEAEGTAQAAGVGSTKKALEQQVRTEIGPAILDGARRVRVSGSLAVADLVDSDDLGPQIRSRLARWAVSETRYYASGRIDLVGRLSLQDLLKPYAVSVASPGEGAAPGGPTGLLVDARGLGLEPAFAPRILDGGGDVLFAGDLFEDTAVDSVAAVYVPDPAHAAAAARAGEAPLILVASAAAGADLVLGDEEAAAFREAGGRTVARGGRMVIVVDP